MRRKKLGLDVMMKGKKACEKATEVVFGKVHKVSPDNGFIHQGTFSQDLEQDGSPFALF